MSTDDDKKSEIERVSLEDLGLEHTDRVIVRANDALVLHELRRMLERQAERDIVIEEMRGLIDKLVDGHVMATEEIVKLKHAHDVLAKQQEEMMVKQDAIAAMCDVFAQRLEDEAADRMRLAHELGDRD